MHERDRGSAESMIRKDGIGSGNIEIGSNVEWTRSFNVDDRLSDFCNVLLTSYM